jgi:hypothetical protein
MIPKCRNYARLPHLVNELFQRHGRLWTLAALIDWPELGKKKIPSLLLAFDLVGGTKD